MSNGNNDLPEFDGYQMVKKYADFEGSAIYRGEYSNIWVDVNTEPEGRVTCMSPKDAKKTIDGLKSAIEDC